jgi:hemoglobin-like flavoprotein
MDDYRDRKRDRDDRPSWRDLDRKKDKSKHVNEERPGGKKKPKVSTGYSQYKDQLDQLFSTGEKSEMVKAVLEKKSGKEILDKEQAPERQKLLRAVREALGEKQLEESLNAFMEKYGELPVDMEVLTQALMHSSDQVREQALRKISRYLDGHVLEKKALLVSRVKNLALTAEDDEVVALAREVKRKLGA